MRKILSFFAFVAIVLTFAACGGKDGNNPETGNITIKVQALSKKVHFVVTSSNPNMDFIFDYVGVKGYYDDFNNPRELAEYYLENEYDGDWHETSYVHKAKYEDTHDVLPNTQYIAFAFYIDANSNIVGEVYSEIFLTMPEYTLNGEFSVSATKKVRFMQSNMYQPNGSVGLSFMTNQWDCVGANTGYPRDLFTLDQAADALPSTAPYHLLPANEWAYLFRERPNAERLFAHATLTIDGNETTGIILLPDNWETPDDIQLTTDFEMEMLWDEQEEEYIKEGLDGYSVNNFDKNQWESLEFAGAVFLPAAGSNGRNRNKYGWYWSSTEAGAHRFDFGSNNINLLGLDWNVASTDYFSIRPVREIK